MVLEDVTELFVFQIHLTLSNKVILRIWSSDYSGSNTKLPKILLNGNNICMVPTPSVRGVCSLIFLGSSSREEKVLKQLHRRRIWGPESVSHTDSKPMCSHTD